MKYILIGTGFAFAAAVQPGPLQAFLLARVASGGWRRTLPASLAPLISDVPIAILALLVLHQVGGGLEIVLRTAGGIVLCFFALSTLRAWLRSSESTINESGSAPRTLLEAVVVNLLNPGPYIGWTLVLGPLALEAWREAPGQAFALVASFYITIVTTMAVFILLLGTTSFLGPRGRRSLLLLSAIALAVIGVYQFSSVWLHSL